MPEIANEHDANVVRVVNSLTLEALNKKNFDRDECTSNSKVRKLAELLQACTELNESLRLPNERNSPFNACASEVCQRAAAVSNIADVLLGDGLDTNGGAGLDAALIVLQEELRVQKDHLDPMIHMGTEERNYMPQSAILLNDDNEFAMDSRQAHYHKEPLNAGWWQMDREMIADRIPDLAALLFVVGIGATIFGFVASFLLESSLPRLLFGVGLGITALGQKIGENAIAHDKH